jgi:hypothetical protein
MLRNIKFLLFTFIHLNCFAQEPIELNEETEYENLEIENNDILELSFNQNETIFINYLTQLELNSQSIFTLQQVTKIVEHIHQYGEINNIYELQQIESFSIDFILKIQSFINFNKPLKTQWKQLKKNKISGEMLFQSSCKKFKSKGYSEEKDSLKFLGNPLKFNSKYKLKLGKELEFCFVNSKDNGEQMKHSFLSASFSFQSNSKLKQLVIGNYQLSLSQGLCLGNGVSLGKSSMVMNVLKLGNKIKPYRSTGQNAYFSGIAFDWKFNKNNQLIFAISMIKKASLNTFDSLRNESFNAIKYNSYNRNLNDLKYNAHNNISTLALSFNHQLKSFCFGINSALIHNNTKSAQNNELYNLHNSQNFILNNSIESKLNIYNALIFNETSVQNKHLAMLSGVLLSLDKKLDLSIIHRYFSKFYNIDYSMAFAESSIKSGKTATYIGMLWSPLKNIQISAYSDIAKYPWLKYSTDAPSQSIENFIEMTYLKRHGIQLKLRKKWEIQSKNETGVQIINKIDLIENTKNRIHIEIPISEKVLLRHRIETNHIHSLLNLNSKGKLIYSDVKIKFNPKTQIIFRAIAFNIDEYQNRIYTFENDLSQSLSIKAYQNKGHSYYVLIQTKISKNLQIKYRFASVHYLNISSMGSGLDEVPGNKQKEVKLELKYSF